LISRKSTVLHIILEYGGPLKSDNMVGFGYMGWSNTALHHFKLDKGFRWLDWVFGFRPTPTSILYNPVFAYLFEHSLIAVDVNQSLHENLGGYFVHAYILV
jgi:hypothetical protein